MSLQRLSTFYQVAFFSSKKRSLPVAWNQILIFGNQMLYFQHIRFNNAEQSTNNTGNNRTTKKKAHIDRNIRSWCSRKSFPGQSETNQRRNHIISRSIMYGKRSGTSLVLQSSTERETNKSTRYNG